jgi:hypothetical protein
VRFAKGNTNAIAVTDILSLLKVLEQDLEIMIRPHNMKTGHIEDIFLLHNEVDPKDWTT